MNIIAVDDERPALRDIERAIAKALPDSSSAFFVSPEEALSYATETRVDVAFLDIEMGRSNGLFLAKRLKEFTPEINIVFVTGYSHYAVDAFEVSASDYLLKPVSPEAVTRAITQLRNPVAVSDTHAVRVQTFGNFEVFSGQIQLHFSRSKTKELFAYLISRQGAQCTMGEIIATLWESEPYTNALKAHYRQLVLDLTQTLKAAGAEDVLLKQRGSLAVIPDKISCDFYRFCQGDLYAVNGYRGEFMSQYSWAEFTNAYLERLIT